MTIAAVIGHPIGHSLSPIIHEYWLQQKHMPGEYRKHDVVPGDLVPVIKKYVAQGYAGINLTLPHKEPGLALCDNLSDAARAVGAVNTLVFANHKIYGDNTDVEGFTENLLPVIGDSALQRAIVLGAGGAARAVVYALKHLGVEFFTILNRDVARAEKLLADLQVSGTARSLASGLLRDDEDAEVLVNTTSLGMKGQPALQIDLSVLSKDTVVADIVYQPLRTELLRAAEKRKLKTVDGLGMLIEQAAAAFEQFYGEEAGERKKLRILLEQRLS
jgi:shikimate dehydrogenase